MLPMQFLTPGMSEEQTGILGYGGTIRILLEHLPHAENVHREVCKQKIPSPLTPYAMGSGPPGVNLLSAQTK